MTCPLYLEYRKTRERYLRGMRRNEAFYAEREKLEQLICHLLSINDEQSVDYWRGRLASVFIRRFRHIDADWLSMLGSLTDCEVIGKYRNPKTVEYLIKLRDLARNKI